MCPARWAPTPSTYASELNRVFRHADQKFVGTPAARMTVGGDARPMTCRAATGLAGRQESYVFRRRGKLERHRQAAHPRARHAGSARLGTGSVIVDHDRLPAARIPLLHASLSPRALR